MTIMEEKKGRESEKPLVELVDVWYKCSSGVSMSMCYVVLRWMMFGVVIG